MCKYTFIALTLPNNLCVCGLISLSTALCCFLHFLDVLQIAVNQSFLPFVLEADQEGSILRQDSVFYIVACFYFTNNAENITTSKGTVETGSWSGQQVSGHPALASLLKILPLFSG